MSKETIHALIARVRGLLAAATRRPWEHKAPALCVDNEDFVWEGVYDADGSNVEDSSANCALIASAPDDLSLLCDEVERLLGVCMGYWAQRETNEAEIAQLKKAIEIKDKALVEASYRLSHERQRCSCYSKMSGSCPNCVGTLRVGDQVSRAIKGEP